MDSFAQIGFNIDRDLSQKKSAAARVVVKKTEPKKHLKKQNPLITLSFEKSTNKIAGHL